MEAKYFCLLSPIIFNDEVKALLHNDSISLVWSCRVNCFCVRHGCSNFWLMQLMGCRLYIWSRVFESPATLVFSQNNVVAYWNSFSLSVPSLYFSKTLKDKDGLTALQVPPHKTNYVFSSCVGKRMRKHYFSLIYLLSLYILNTDQEKLDGEDQCGFKMDEQMSVK